MSKENNNLWLKELEVFKNAEKFSGDYDEDAPDTLTITKRAARNSGYCSLNCEYCGNSIEEENYYFFLVDHYKGYKEMDICEIDKKEVIDYITTNYLLIKVIEE